jgi:hypothetical protein
VNERDSSGATDATEETEPEVQATEQTTNYADTLLALAREDGHSVGLEDPPEETEEETETTEADVPGVEPKAEEEPVETEEEDKEEEEKPEQVKDAGEKLVPLREVLAERDKKKRANERAEQAEAKAAQLEAALSQSLTPKPTEDDPFRDILDPNQLDRLEASYEKAVELADEYPDGAEGIVVGHKPNGDDITMDFTREKMAETKRKAEKAIRKFIPERRSYLQQRSVADQQAAQIYPELQDPNSDFTKAVATLAHSLMSGQAMKAPDILVWIGHAVKGYQMASGQNGNGSTKVKSPEAKKIVEAAKTKIAPTPTRSRSYVERGTRSVNVDKAAKKFEQRGDTDSAEELVGALLSKHGGSKRLEPIGN